MTRLAVFASGSGSNAQKIFEYFQGHTTMEVVLVVTDRKMAGVLTRAQDFGIESQYFPKSTFSENPTAVLNALNERQIDFIILAGFLLLMPELLVSHFEGRIINIHPALLPRFGGAGMYGHHVHEAVKQSGESQSGMTIHEVNHEYDSGRIIFQARCPVFPSDSVSDIAARVLSLEHEHYALVAEQFIIYHSRNIKANS